MSHSLALFPLLLLLTALAANGCASHTHARPSPAPPSPTPPRGFLFGEHTLPDGGAMNYAVYIPRDAHKSRDPLPCILFLHGRGESGTDGNKMLIQGLGAAVQWNADAWPFVIIFPQKPDPNRPWDDYASDVMQILSRVRSQQPIDGRRIHLTGLSQGGRGAWVLAARNPGAFAAVAPVCGVAPTESPKSIAAALGDTPVWAFHGELDDVVPPASTRAIIDALRAERSTRAGTAETKATFFPKANHNAWDPAYRETDLAGWFLGHALPERERADPR